MITLFHGTSKNNWKSIQKDGILYQGELGRLWLTSKRRIAKNFGEYVLHVRIDEEKLIPSAWNKVGVFFTFDSVPIADILKVEKGS